MAPTALPAQPGDVRPALTVTAAPVEPTEMRSIVTGTGSVVAWQELVVAAESSGQRVLEVLVDEGETIQAGQILLRLNDRALQAGLRQLDSNIRETEASLANAQSELRRAQELAAGRTVTEQTLEQRLTAVRTSEAKVNAAKAQRDEVLARIAQTEIRSPSDGLVAKRSILVGAVVNAGTELLRIIRDNRLELNAEVPELELGLIRPNQPARVAHGGTPFEGTVRTVAPVVDPATRMGVVRIRLPAGAALSIGMFARAEIHVSDVSALVVPQEAIVFRDGRPSVFELGQDSRVVMRPIETGRWQEGLVEVKAGLPRGARIVVTGSAFLADGDAVRVQQQAASTETTPGPQPQRR